MATKAGVWIDHHKAVIVQLNDKSEEIQEIHANESLPASVQTPTQSQIPYLRNDFIAEDKLERKEIIGHNHFYDKVRSAMNDADTILVFGPGEAKGEFVKRFEAENRRPCSVEVQTTDKLTDNQIAKFVRQHYQKS